MTGRLHVVPPPDDHYGFTDPAQLLDGLVQFRDATEIAVQAPGAEDLRSHLGRLGNRPVTTGPAGDELLADIAAERLTGCGGGHFPVARKWQRHQDAGGGGFLVGNGAESEPLSVKDAALMQLRPHLVLDGMACAAQATGARECVLWLHESAGATRSSMTRALAERAAANVNEPGVRITLAPDHYLSGESSSVVRALSGGPALPQFRRRPAALSGVDGQPTLIHNVETLARIGLIARRIVPDSVLVTVATEQARTVVEMKRSGLLTDALAAAGFRGPLGAVLIGGYGGRWLAASAALAATLDPTGLARHHAVLGAGVLRPVRSDQCGLRVTAEIAEYLARSSAGQCGPCLYGLRSLADTLGALVVGQARPQQLAQLHRHRAEIAGRGACHHPDGAVGMIASALDVFEHDVAAHLHRGRCAVE
jgi:NADH:ubiquinone oxidoreductase subunit F (NADH-binding)